MLGFDGVPDSALYPFESRWFESTVGRVHYIDEGAGPPIVFCHGSPTWSFMFRRVVSGLRDRFRCIAVDYPGFGLSERPAGFGYTIAEQVDVLGDLIDHLRLDGFVVVGHDWGGPIGLASAAQVADRVRGIVLGNSLFWPVDALPNRAFSVIMGSRPMRRCIVQRNVLVERFLIGSLGDTLTEAEADQYRLVQATPDARVGLAVMPGQIRVARPLLTGLARDVPALLGAKPALAIWGMRDPVFRPTSCLPRIRAAFDNLNVVELSRARHFIFEEEPETICSVIAQRFS